MRRLAVLALLVAGCGGKSVPDPYIALNPCPANAQGVVDFANDASRALDLAGIPGLPSLRIDAHTDLPQQMDPQGFDVAFAETNGGATVCAFHVDVRMCKARTYSCGG